jgi:hypothetical protein
VSIKYDGDGNRIFKTVAGVTTGYLLDDRNPTGYVQVLAEVQSSSITRSYVYGLELIEQDRTNTGTLRQNTSYNVYDGHGSVRALTDTTGGVTDAYDYDASTTSICPKLRIKPPVLSRGALMSSGLSGI